MRESIGDKLTEPEYSEIREYMLNMKTLGSMRLLWSAGRAVKKNKHLCLQLCLYCSDQVARFCGSDAYSDCAAPVLASPWNIKPLNLYR